MSGTSVMQSLLVTKNAKCYQFSWALIMLKLFTINFGPKKHVNLLFLPLEHCMVDLPNNFQTYGEV